MKKWTYLVVFLLHLPLIFLAIPEKQPKKEEKKPIQIRTVVHPTPKEIITTSSSIPKKKSPSQAKQKKSKPKKKKTPPSRIAKKGNRKPSKKIQGPTIPDDLLRQLEESIAKIEKKSDNCPPERKLLAPGKVGRLEVEGDVKGDELAYATQLTKWLKERLELPQRGEVTISLTLQSEGLCRSMQIVKSSSIQNQKFIKHALDGLRYPPFSGELKNEAEHTFVLTFYSN